MPITTDVKFEQCVEPHFYKYQAKQLKRCVEEHKWYLSERAHHDVGWEYAQQSFMEVYMQGFAAGFRVSYCGLVCPNRNCCSIGKRYALKDDEY